MDELKAVDYSKLIFLILKDHANYERAKDLCKEKMVLEIEDHMVRMADLREMIQEEIDGAPPNNVVTIKKLFKRY